MSFGPYSSFGFGGSAAGADNKAAELIETFPCGENISSGKVVMLISGKLFNFDADNVNFYGRAIGVSNQSGVINGNCDVVLKGYTNQMGGLVMDMLYYADTNGDVSLTGPATGINQSVGISISATEMMVDIQKPIIRI